MAAEYYTQAVAGCFVIDSRTALDNPNLPLTSPAIWDEVFGGGGRSQSGVSVTPKTALSYAPVWQATSMISGDVARLPLMVFRRRWQGDTEYFDAQPDHRLSYLLGVAPNDEETAVDFWSRVMVHALIWSNAYIYYDAARGEMFTLLPDRTTPARTNGGELYYVTEAGGTLKPILAEQVLHVRGLTIDGMAECALMQAARDSWGNGLAMQKFQAKFFANGGRIGGILELPQGMPKPARDQVEEGFRKSYEGADNPFKTVILRDNAKFHAAQMSPTDAQLAEATEQQVRQVARWFNLPPAKLGLADASAYNAQEQTNQAYLDQTLAIWLKRIQAQCVARMLTQREQKLYTIRHVLTDLLKMDQKKHAEMSEILIRSRVKRPNEVRAELSMLPYEGGDEFAPPAQQQQPAAPQLEAEVEDDTEDDAEDSAEMDAQRMAARRILYSLTYRARKKAASPSAFLTWLDSGWVNERAEWTTISSGAVEPSFFSAMHDQMQQVASTATADQLSAFVETVAANFEKDA